MTGFIGEENFIGIFLGEKYFPTVRNFLEEYSPRRGNLGWIYFGTLSRVNLFKE